MQRKPRVGPAPGTKRVLRLDVAYDGTEYVGWQRQAKGTSIQGCMEKAISKVASEPVTLFSSSRTDAGVHARQQVVSFSLMRSRAPIAAFVDGVNSLLPEDIRVLKAEEMDLLFHAQLAKEKTYRYFIQTGRQRDVFLRSYSWHVPRKIDLEQMREASAHLVGTHDFKAFQASNSDIKTTVRSVKQADWLEGPLGLLTFEITASGFLKHMVRNIVGTLVDIGVGKRFPSEMRVILDSRDRKRGGQAAPGRGLFLWNVVY